MPEALKPDGTPAGGAAAQDLVAISRQIEAIASRAAEEIEAVFFAYAKSLRTRAGVESNAEEEAVPFGRLRRTAEEL
ncbi:MAG: hypothetical protein R3C30_10770 [Hyphomonadaceae bacterium]